MQIVVDYMTQTILAIAFSSGKTHDLELFRRSRVRIHHDILSMYDLGYYGMHHYDNVLMPHKKPKNGDLEKWQKDENREISSIRVFVEHVFGFMKTFKILGTRYRNRRRRIGLRALIISCFYNEIHSAEL